MFVVSAVLEWGLGMRGAHTYSGKLGFHYSGRWHTLTDPDGRFFVDPDPHSHCTQPREPTTHTGTEREVARARARRARAWGLGGVDRHPGEVRGGGSAPPNHKFSLRRARDAPLRARARVVAHNLGPGVEPGPPSFCTCAREKKTSCFYEREAMVVLSEFES